MYTLTRDTFNTKNMVKISVLGVISMVLMFFDLSVWFAPPFLKLDISDLPSLIGAFAMGPMAGVITQLLKNILHLLVQGSSTGGVGEISNFFVGSVLAYTAGVIYYKQKTFKRAVVGLAIGVILMSIFASLSNYFVIFPLYSKILPLDQIIAMASKLNKYVVDYKTLILFAIVPFNLLKGTVVSIITLLIYKRVSPVLHR
ncbi:ECF transporter S component [Tissierella creatinophila]|uniref:Riboflavin transporter n=1 Tax=Tissierella creatinophila DSM 6911 TaxID=1123403 RepID=A0A1U7M3F9_TISCR|nr:ECF transporter S component [Tissierella creatinophila]OLS01854.1 riboflavin transporter RibU [Tissierella creatinophila DSM 6911]